MSDVPDFLTAAARKYARASKENRLGEEEERRSTGTTAHTLSRLRSAIPWQLMLSQLLWTTLVVFVFETSSNENALIIFLRAHLIAPSGVVHALGWGLFVLLAFYVSLGATRYSTGARCITSLKALVFPLARCIRFAYRRGKWHHGDYNRLVAHLAAFPICVKMHLCGQLDEDQLKPLLDDNDIKQILSMDLKFLRCLYVILAYLSDPSIGTADQEENNQDEENENTPIDPPASAIHLVQARCTTHMAISLAPTITITRFAPAKPYIATLIVVSALWFALLPLSLVEQCREFTIVISLLITYFIGMMFRLAHDLTFPFDEGILTIPLTRELAALSAELLYLCAGRSTHEQGSPANHDDPDDNQESSSLVVVSESPHVSQWPTVSTNTYGTIPTIHTSSAESAEVAVRRVGWYARSRAVAIPLILFAIWSFAVTVYTYSIAPLPVPGEVCRWWCVHLPVGENVLSYISLGLFLLLSFWLDSAYGQYESGVFLWNVQVRRLVSELAVLFSKCLPPADRPRALAHLSAIPFVVGAWLRETPAFTSLEAVLAPDDLDALKASPDPITHSLTVLSEYAYGASRSVGNAAHALTQTTIALEKAIVDCQAVKKVSVPPPYTHHLALFITVWLGLIPFTSVQQLGFFAIIVLMPVAYSVTNLFNIGCEMADPFGTDPHDIPVIPIAHEMRAVVQQTYLDMCSSSNHEQTEDFENGREQNSDSNGDAGDEDHFSAEGDPETNGDREGDEDVEKLSLGEYPRSKFQLSSADPEKQSRPDVTPSPQKSLRAILRSLPSVGAVPQVVATIWMIVAVFLSRALSYLWTFSSTSMCRNWCSPIDINSGTLSNIGFALFTILAFRAADAIERYEKGAALLYDLRSKLRSTAVELCLISGSDSAKLRRIVAHLTQIPLSLRDELLAVSRSEHSNESLLSDSDWQAVARHPEPVNYLIGIVESFVLEINAEACKNIAATEPIYPNTDRLVLLDRLNDIREMAATAYHVKRFPVIPSYTQHQRVFTALWLFLLPLSMTADTGWYTILWAPMIAYGVFGLETIANKLVDPFGDDDIDIPVDELCRHASNAVLDGVLAVNWGSVDLPDAFEQPSSSGFGVTIAGSRVLNQFNLPRLEKKVEEGSNGNFAVTFSSAVEERVTPTLYAHFVHSIPWPAIFVVSCWALIAITVSYTTREHDPGMRWWASRISVSPDVAGYVSFGAFFLLGFYVRLAYQRYREAGIVWSNLIPGGCLSLVGSWMTMFESGRWHDGDTERVVGYIAAIPIVMKHSVRDSRDLRDLQGLLSPQDIAAIQQADDMPTHCVDVLRSYYYHPQMLKDEGDTEDQNLSANRRSFIGPIFGLLDAAIKSSRFLHEFQFAKGFAQELNFLLGLWFVLLPLVLAEISGWISLLWIPIIGLSILGMYAVAEELQMPFGHDLNDLDLDYLADLHMNLVMGVYAKYKGGRKALISNDGSHPIDGPPRPAPPGESLAPSWSEVISISLRSVSWRVMLAVTVWSVVCTALAHYVAKTWYVGSGMCVSGWCSLIAVPGPVQAYIGFAFFLLLGFKLADSHGRYASGQTIWNERMNGASRFSAVQVHGAYDADTFHDGDRARFMGHLSAFSTGMADMLDGDRGYMSGLSDVVNADAAARIRSIMSSGFYCLDVCNAYVMEADERLRKRARSRPVDSGRLGCHWTAADYIGSMGAAGGALLEIVHIPLPYGYVTHIKTFAIVWVGVLPLEIVESAGWMAIPWTILIVYCVLSILTWAEQLAQPFGDDFADLPLESFRRKSALYVKETMEHLKDGFRSFIEPDRTLFQHYQESAAKGSS